MKYTRQLTILLFISFKLFATVTNAQEKFPAVEGVSENAYSIVNSSLTDILNNLAVDWQKDNP
jgi:hypothetical protein